VATYLELYDLMSNESFIKRVKFALYRYSGTLLNGTPTVPQQTFARRMLTDSLQELKQPMIMLRVCLAPTVIASGAAVTDTDLRQ
jgi:hypothetical protein